MPRRGRPRKGDRRIDAAIDHFAAMGYAARDVRAIVDKLLKLYGGPDAWPLLEEASYQVVQGVLFEKQEEEEKKLLQLEHHHQEHQELAVDEAPPKNNMTMLQLHDEVPAEPESPDAGVEGHVFAELPAPEAVVPLPVAIGTGGTTRPCYGWLSESEDEEELNGHQPEVHVLSPGGGLLCKRKQPE